jgi:hypothetical protein
MIGILKVKGALKNEDEEQQLQAVAFNECNSN